MNKLSKTQYVKVKFKLKVNYLSRVNRDRVNRDRVNIYRILAF